METDPSVDIDIDRKFQERHWLVSRVSWLVLLTLLIVAHLGLTGSGGPLSRQRATAGPAELDVPRISRWAAADHLSIRIDQAAAHEIEIVLPQRFGRIFAIESVVPQPASVTATPGGHRYLFSSSDGPGERTVVFSMRASHPSLRSHMGRFVVNGEATGELSVLVLP